MAKGSLSKHTTTDRRTKRNAVKFPTVLREFVQSDLKPNGTDVARKRKHETDTDLDIKRRRNENIPSINETFVSFNFEPVELNCHRFVSTRLQCLLDSCDLNSQFEFGKDLLIIHHPDVPAEEICLQLFASQSSCAKAKKDGAVLKNTVVICYIDEHLEKNKLSQELAVHLTKCVEKDHLFYASAPNKSKSIGKFLETYKMKVSPKQIITRTSQMSRVYGRMYEDLEEKVESVKKAIHTLPEESKMRPILRKFACIENKLKERKKPKPLSEDCERDLKSALDFGVIAYRTDGENLTVYINQPRTRLLDAKLRELEKKCSPLNLRCCRVQTPFYRPHCLRAGCRVDNRGISISGTIGTFAKKIRENAEIDIGITSAHVIWKGCSARAHVKDGDEEIGFCTWPPTPSDKNLEARVLDMAVIELRSDMADKISTSENISVYRGQKDILKCQMVYKSGWKTGTTFGDIEYPQFNMFGKKVMMITTANGQHFSEPGDSGALVLTEKGKQLLALGLVFGDDLEFRQSDEDFPENASIAIYLDEAISRFEEESKNEKIKIHRY